MTDTAHIPTFFADGIQFECVHCGMCCTGQPGIVQINTEEIDTLAAFLSVSMTECVQRFLTPHEGGYRIQERSNGDCIFFDNGCSIHPVRPAQCRTYPFWVKNMRSQAAWQRTRAECPGIGLGRLYTESEILDTLEGSPL